jgi:predicted ferric reductase
MATAATALLVTAAALSVRAARQRMSHETWHFVHLYMYLAIALSFGHQLMVGSDLSTDPVAEAYWVTLYVAVFGAVLGFRVGQPLRLAARHRLRVASIVEEAPGVHSLYITGRRLDELPVRAGQFFRWRFLTRDAWWRAHPFSLSAAPNGRFLRITFKVVGDHTAWLRHITPGTPVIAEGPHGVFTSLRRSQPRALLIAAGIGITPLRALLEEMPGGKGRLALIYRGRALEDMAFRDEIDQIMRPRAGVVHYVVGRRGRDLDAHPLGPQALRRMVPDIHTRDIFVCGPQAMIDEVCRGLRQIGIPERQIHRERFALLEHQPSSGVQRHR